MRGTGYFFKCPNTKDDRILGSISGSPYLGKTTSTMVPDSFYACNIGYLEQTLNMILVVSVVCF